METEPGLLVAPTSYADQIAQVLEQEILQGRYVRGQSLQQDELTRRFGVSRTPAREALRKLQALGLVELIPNKSAIVQVPTLDELAEVYAIRAELEGYAAALAAQARTPEQLARLRQAHARLTATVASAADTPIDSVTIDERLRVDNDKFHSGIHAASGNRKLAALVRDLERYFPKDIVRRALSTTQELKRFYVDDHVAVLAEIEHRHIDQARAAMRLHIHHSQEMLLRYLREKRLGEQPRE